MRFRCFLFFLFFVHVLLACTPTRCRPPPHRQSCFSYQITLCHMTASPQFHCSRLMFLMSSSQSLLIPPPSDWANCCCFTASPHCNSEAFVIRLIFSIVFFNFYRNHIFCHISVFHYYSSIFFYDMQSKPTF